MSHDIQAVSSRDISPNAGRQETAEIALEQSALNQRINIHAPEIRDMAHALPVMSHEIMGYENQLRREEGVYGLS
jgi:hypothetical protein